MEEREGFRANEVRLRQPRPWGARGPHGGKELLWPWGPRPPSRRGPSGLMATHLSRALPHVLQPYLGHPNSDFESVFKLQTVNPSHMTTTTKL